MDITSIESHIAVRWSLPLLGDGERFRGGGVSTSWQGRQVQAQFLIAELNAMEGDLDVSTHPAIRPWLATVLPKSDMDTVFSEGSYQEPLVRISLFADVPTISEFVTERNDGVSLKSTADEPATRTVSYEWLSRVTDLVLDLSSHALQTVLDDAVEFATEASPPVLYRVAGPLCMADLAGAGAAVLRDDANEEFVLPLLSRAPLGSRGAPLADKHDTSRLHGTGFHLGNARRLYEWNQRHSLRLIRGEWAESVVGLEAAVEQFLWSISESIMVEHGWARADIEESNRVPNLFSLYTFLQHHLQGNAAEWRRVRREVLEPVWNLRNSVIHRASTIDESTARAYSSALNQLLRFLKPKFAARRRQHPLTAYLWSQECLSVEEQAVVERVTSHPDLTDTRDINDLMPWAFAPEVETSLTQCPPVDRIQMLDAAWARS